MSIKYKALLYETPQDADFLYISQIKKEELQRPKPVDSILLNKRCYKSAENHFFKKRGWAKTDFLHIEIEDQPRVIEA